MTREQASCCDQCNTPVPDGSRFCRNCGRPFLPPASNGAGQETGFTWETNISLLTNPLILKQMVFVVVGAGLIMALLLSFILALTGEYGDIPMIWLISLFTTLGLGLLLCLVTLIFFGNRMRVRFTVDGKGILWETIDKRAKVASRLAILAGILGRSPQAAGAGTLAVAREKEFVRWQDLSAVTYNNGRRMMTLRNSWRPLMLVVCLPQNYGQVAAFVEEKVVSAPVGSTPRRLRPLGKGPLGKGLLRTLTVTLAAAPTITLSSYPFYLDIFLPLLMFLFALATVWLVPLFGWVVIGCAAILALQIAWIGIFEVSYLYGVEIIAILVSYAGLAYLVWFSWGALRGRIGSALMED